MSVLPPPLLEGDGGDTLPPLPWEPCPACVQAVDDRERIPLAWLARAQVLSYHIIPGEALTLEQLRAMDGQLLQSMLEGDSGMLKVRRQQVDAVGFGWGS